jgi:mono/diheme cytochrome c family protein
MRHALAAIWPAAVVLGFAAAPASAQEAKLDATQQMGQHLFNQSCRVCHAKPQFNSAQYGPVLSKTSASGNARGMHDVIANGTPRMPGFKYHFKPEQIDAIVAYLMTVPPPAAAAPAAAPKRSGADAD